MIGRQAPSHASNHRGCPGVVEDRYSATPHRCYEPVGHEDDHVCWCGLRFAEAVTSR